MDLLGLRAPQLVLRPLSVPPRKRVLAASADQGRNREDPQNKWFRQLVGMSPKPPPRAWEPRAMAPWSLPGASSRWRLPFGKTPQQSDIARAQSHVASKSVSKSGFRCSLLKPNKEARSVERKVGFFSDICNQREGRLLSKGQLILLPLTSSEQELLKGIFRVV